MGSKINYFDIKCVKSMPDDIILFKSAFIVQGNIIMHDLFIEGGQSSSLLKICIFGINIFIIFTFKFAKIENIGTRMQNPTTRVTKCDLIFYYIFYSNFIFEI